MRFALLAATAAVLSVSPLAHADTVFDLTSNLTSGNAVSGTVTIDTTAGQVTSLSLTSTGFGIPDETYTSIFGQGQYFYVGSGYYGIVADSPDDASEVIIGVPGSGLSGYTGSTVRLTINTTAQQFIGSGSLAPNGPIPTPEPSAFALLGTGLLALPLALRRLVS